MPTSITHSPAPSQNTPTNPHERAPCGLRAARGARTGSTARAQNRKAAVECARDRPAGYDESVPRNKGTRSRQSTAAPLARERHRHETPEKQWIAARDHGFCMALERLRKSTKRNKQPSGNIIGQMRDERSAPYSDGSQKGAGSDRTPENARLICELPSRPAESSNVFPVDRRPKTAVYSTSPNSIVHSREFAFHIGQNRPEPGFHIDQNQVEPSSRPGQNLPCFYPIRPSPAPPSSAPAKPGPK